MEEITKQINFSTANTHGSYFSPSLLRQKLRDSHGSFQILLSNTIIFKFQNMEFLEYCCLESEMKKFCPYNNQHFNLPFL